MAHGASGSQRFKCRRRGDHNDHITHGVSSPQYWGNQNGYITRPSWDIQRWGKQSGYTTRGISRSRTVERWEDQKAIVTPTVSWSSTLRESKWLHKPCCLGSPIFECWGNQSSYTTPAIGIPSIGENQNGCITHAMAIQHLPSQGPQLWGIKVDTQPADSGFPTITQSSCTTPTLGVPNIGGIRMAA